MALCANVWVAAQGLCNSRTNGGRSRTNDPIQNGRCQLAFKAMGRLDSDSHAVLLDGSTVLLRRLDSGDFEEVVGVANYFTCKPPDYAEVAVVVAHNQHLRGVGTALLRQLGLVARQNGLHHFVADILAENYPMLQVMSDAGWRF